MKKSKVLKFEGNGFADIVDNQGPRLKVWARDMRNFGKNGLPKDIEEYIAWRYDNPHKDIGEFKNGEYSVGE